MTVKQLHEMTPAQTYIYIVTGEKVHELERENQFDVDVYGRYVIAQIKAIGPDEIEIKIKTIYVTEE